MNWKTGLFAVLLTASNIGAFTPATGHADTLDAAITINTAVAADTNTTKSSTTTNDAQAAGAGCLAGGALGSVVPVFGTLLGCAIGGAVGWWW